MATALRLRMTQDLHLVGLSDSTQRAYLRSVRMLADHFHTPPDRLHEDQVRDDLLHLKNDRHFAPAFLGIAYCGFNVFRVAIGDHRIVSCDDGRVTFTYRKVGSNRRRTMTLDATEFRRRFLQHVLPRGFARVRH